MVNWKSADILCSALTETNTDPFSSFGELLDKAGKTVFHEIPDPTFLEITSYPQLENVASNILAFFLDPSAAHGLGTLLLSALLDKRLADDLSEVKVDTEVQTNNEKRLDIVVSSIEYVICIENKIWASANNPFKEYSNHLKSIADGRTVVKKLLSIKKPEADCDGFEFISYAELIENVRSRLGHFVHKGNPKYVLFLSDFLQAIENLIKRDPMIEPEFVELIRKRESEVMHFSKKLHEFRRELSTKVDEVKGLLSGLESRKDSIMVSTYNPEKQAGKLARVLAYDVLRGDTICVISPVISAEGWAIEMLPRKSDVPLSKLEKILNEANIPFKNPGKLASKDIPRVVYEKQLPFNASAQEVADLVRPIIEKIMSSAPVDVATKSGQEESYTQSR